MSAKSAAAGNAAGSDTRTDRVMSVDVLRGFDMFWLVGGMGLALAVIRLAGPTAKAWLLPQTDHAKWVGFTFYDFIFPLFVFVVGMSVVFSLTKLLEQKGRWAAYKRIARRVVLMYLLGVFYYGGMSHVWSEIRWLGVLQRLALCYGISGLLYCHLKLRGLLVVCVALLVGYWALLTFVPVPGATAVSWEKGENWATYIDAHFLPGQKHEGTWDAEGLLSTLPAVSSCLMGVFAAMLLANKSVPDAKKALYFISIGAALAVVGGLWGLQLPIIKMIWTSSYALLAGGLSFALLGVLYLVVDVWKIRAWVAPFIWIGANPLTIYLARNMFDFNKLADRFVGGSIQATLGPDWGYFVRMVVSLGLSLAVVRFLYVKKVFLRV